MQETAAEKIPNGRYELFTFDSCHGFLPWILILLTVALMTVILRFDGRIWWCKLDTPLQLISLSAWSEHSSQHFLDPYSLTHVLHGFLFAWIIGFFVNKVFRRKISFAWLLFFAVFAESAWEIFENSPIIIERYRQSTASLGYVGDSITNSIGDIISCALGFVVAFKLKFWRSLALLVAIEVFLLATIQDSLLINIIMLIYPIEAIKLWQTGGL